MYNLLLNIIKPICKEINIIKEIIKLKKLIKIQKHNIPALAMLGKST